MRFEETLEYLYARLPMYQRIGPKAIKPGLDQIRKLLALLDEPQEKFQSIHIAGTNGKGSTAHFIAACLQAAGYRVGLYTSPHYRDFRERIKINGVLIPKREVTAFVLRHRDRFEHLQPSFFEYTVAMAFDYFDRQKVDFCVIETGLGGRLDSTNVITPLLSVITNIDFDHTETLGETLPQIAFEKAGIIKPNVPVVIGEYAEETAPVFMEKAAGLRAPIYFADLEYDVVPEHQDIRKLAFSITGRRGHPDLSGLAIPTGAGYQIKNVRTAVCALRLLKTTCPEIRLTDNALRKGLSDYIRLTYFLGRWQILGEDPLILCDSAHNAHGLREVTNALKNLAGQRRLHLVLGFVRDKDHHQFIRFFPAAADYYICKPDVPRGESAAHILSLAQSLGLRARKYTSVRRALAAARRRASKEDLIFVGGSSFVVAEVL